MRVAELLDELRHNQLRDLSDQVGGTDKDQLWSDATLVRYLNQSQNKFASLTECIRDSTTPEVTEVAVTAGNAVFILHPKVIAVLSVRYPGDQADLPRAGHDALDNYHQPDRRWFDGQQFARADPGKPKAWTTDEGVVEDTEGSFNAMELRMFPAVGTGFDAVLKLRVARLPLRELSTTKLDARLEIPERYHMDILDWAGYLALRGPDLDVAGGDGFARAMDLRKSFINTVADCKRDMNRRMFAPMYWDFGRNGFTWERD